MSIATNVTIKDPLQKLNFSNFLVNKYRMQLYKRFATCFATETARFRRVLAEERERKKSKGVSATASPGLGSPTLTQFVSSIHSKSPINRSPPLSVHTIRTLSILKLLPSMTVDIWIMLLVVHNSLLFVCCA